MDGQRVVFEAAIIAAIAAPIAFGFALARAKDRPRRRRILRLGAIAAVGYLFCCYTFFLEPSLFLVRHATVVSAQWHGPPLRIGVIGDTHVGGPHVSPARVARIVERMNRERPDIVVLLGDYVNDHDAASIRSKAANETVREGVLALGALRAPRGTFAVLGNHDVLYGPDLIRKALSDAGVTVLENRAIAIRGLNAYVVGFGELSKIGVDVDQATARVPAGASMIVLMHWPDSFARSPAVSALSLAGHSHCGQVVLPFLLRAFPHSQGVRRYRCGLYHEQGRTLYVTGGIGTSILPMRFLAPPEIAVVTLKAP